MAGKFGKSSESQRRRRETFLFVEQKKKQKSETIEGNNNNNNKIFTIRGKKKYEFGLFFETVFVGLAWYQKTIVNHFRVRI